MMKGGSDWRQMFVGRQTELKAIQRAWKLVDSPDGETPQPQCVILLSESGYGKTRIVQEFYQWLSATHDPASEAAPEGYWPDLITSDTESLDVNPRFTDSSAGRGAIPWLWWGLRFASPFRHNATSSGCGLVDYANAFAIHTEPVIAARKLSKLRHDVFWKTLSLLGTFVPFLGQLVTVKDSRSLKRDRELEQQLLEQQTRSAGETSQVQRIGIEQLLLDYFRTVLDPENSEARTVPVVLFLDDVQFADPETLAFLDQLFAEARKDNWKLLLICTHWEREWHEHRTCTPDKDGPQSFREIIEGLKAEDLDYATWLHERFVPPLPELSELLDTALPGLSPQQRDKFLRKASGNGRYLREAISWFYEETDLFDNRSIDRCLTPDGENALDNLPTGLKALVHRRFQSMDQAVKHALGWSSEQGLRFLTQITLASARCVDASIGEAELRQRLRKAQIPYSLIDTLGDPGRFNRSEFRQAVYHEIASDHLKLRVNELACVQGSIRDTLIQWLTPSEEGDGPSIGSLTAEERYDALMMARHSLSASTQRPVLERMAWARGMAMLAILCRDQFRWKMAQKVVGEWASAADVGWPADCVDIETQKELGEILISCEEFSTASKYLRKLADSLPAPIDAEGLDFDPLEKVHVLHKLAYAESCASGTQSTAAALWHEASDLTEEYIDEYGASTDRLMALSMSIVHLGHLEAENRRLDSALQHYQNAYSICQEVAEETGGTESALRSLSVTAGYSADVAAAMGKFEFALTQFQSCEETFREIIARCGESADRLRDLFIALRKISGIQAELGKCDVAETNAMESLRVANRALELSGSSPWFLDDIADINRLVGNVLADQARFSEAEPYIKRFLEINLQLADECAERSGLLSDIAIGYGTLADLAGIQGRLDESIDGLIRANEVFERVINEFVVTPQTLRDLMVGQNKLGTAFRQKEEHKAAHDAYHRGFVLSSRIVNEFGETQEGLRDLGISHNYVGQCLATAGRKAEAEKHMRQGCAIFQRLATERDPTPRALLDVAQALRAIGALELDDGRHEQGLATSRLGMNHAGRLLQQFGPIQPAQILFSKLANQAARAAIQLGRPDEALEALQQARLVIDECVSTHGEIPESLIQVVDTRRNLANVDPDHALEHLEIAKAEYSKLVDRDWANSEQSTWGAEIDASIDELDA